MHAHISTRIQAHFIHQIFKIKNVYNKDLFIYVTIIQQKWHIVARLMSEK